MYAFSRDKSFYLMFPISLKLMTLVCMHLNAQQMRDSCGLCTWICFLNDPFIKLHFNMSSTV